MPRSDRAPSRSWRRSGTSFCSASSSCATRVRRPLLHPKLRLAVPEAAQSESIFRRRTEMTDPQQRERPETLEEKLSHPATSPDFDLKTSVNEVLADVG